MPRLLLIDNFDSFTFILRDYLQRYAHQVDVLRNYDPKIFDLQGYDGVVISPGPRTPQASGRLIEFVYNNLEYIPMLGICLGHQALGLALGGKLERSDTPWHGVSTKIHLQPHPMFGGLGNSIEVGRYHSLYISGLDENIVDITATDQQGLAMAFAHKSLPLWGIQFHPESCMTNGGERIIENWVGGLASTLPNSHDIHRERLGER